MGYVLEKMFIVLNTTIAEKEKNMHVKGRVCDTNQQITPHCPLVHSVFVLKKPLVFVRSTQAL